MAIIVSGHHLSMDLRVTALFAAIVATVVAGTAAQVVPLANEVAPIAILLDIVPFGSALAAAVITALRLRPVSVSPVRLVVAAFGYFAGALVATLGFAHLVAVVIMAIGRGRQDQFVYNFHFYSVFLLGVLLIAAGAAAAFQAERSGRGRFAAWSRSLWVWSGILVINLPLVPLQGFAVLFSVLASAELLLLICMRSHLSVVSLDNTSPPDRLAGRNPLNR